MKFETVLTAMAIVIVGAIAIWFTVGPIVIGTLETIINALAV